MLFQNHTNKLKRPYIVNADTECALVPPSLTGKSHTHVPKSACVYCGCDYDSFQHTHWCDIGPKCIVHIMVELTQLPDKRILAMRNNQET